MELQIFNNSEFGQIRSLVLDDEVYRKRYHNGTRIFQRSQGITG